MSTLLRLHQTQRFCTLSLEESNLVNFTPPSNAALPVLSLADLLLHERRGSTTAVRNDLVKHLQRHGYCILTTPKKSLPACIISNLRESLENDFFPDECDNNTRSPLSSHFINRGNLQTSQTLYISERGVPMWKLGYELCEDQVREVFRLHAGEPDSHQAWPSCSARQNWLRGLALCRHVCDQALDLVFDNTNNNIGNETFTLSSSSSEQDAVRNASDLPTTFPKKRERPGSGGRTWISDAYCKSIEGTLASRSGDFSVLYAMHYFNPDNEHKKHQPNEATVVDKESSTDTGNVIINVKQHADPSLFVLEPFLAEAEGLQVWDTHWQQWLTCDGPTSPVHSVLDTQQHAMILFVGKAFCAHFPSVSPTLHRVIGSSQRRRTMIYEQKYEEFFPPPILD